MAVLRRPRWEHFAQLLARGESANSAYLIVGYKKSDQNAARLAKNGLVLNRVNELLTRKDETFERADVRAANAAKISKQWVLSNLVDEIETSDQSVSRIKALELVGRELGMFVNRTEIGTPGSFEACDTPQSIVDQVRRELGDDYANAMAALLEAKRPKVIEHQQSNVLFNQGKHES